MQRLTFEGNFCDIAQCAEMHDCDYGEKKCSQRKTWERLKEYEDTGLSPLEVATLKEENARLHNENFWLSGQEALQPTCNQLATADNDYIKRRYLRKMAMLETAYTMETQTDASIVLRMIDDAPAADVAPVRHGRWVPLEYDGYADGCPVYHLWECSECQEEHSGDEDTLTTYCPNCGAKMDGAE